MLELDPHPALEALVAKLTAGGDPAAPWPIRGEEKVLTELNTWAAWRESDRDKVRTVAGWPQDRPGYKLDPVAELIADSWAAFLFGEEPTVTPADPADAERLADLLDLDASGGTGTRFTTDLYEAARISVSEGEVWARVYNDPRVAPRPLLEWHSRRSVIPLFMGPRLIAAAIVTEVGKSGRRSDENIYRALELHADGVVVNVLFAGGETKLGPRVELDRHPATSELEERWQHDLPGMLVERIENRRGRSRELGRSEYAGILDVLIDLNEAATIGSTNMRLTARKRVVVSAETAARQLGGDASLTPEEPSTRAASRVKLDPSEEAFIADPLNAELGANAPDPFRVLEYSFDAEALIKWRQDLTSTGLSRIGLNSQWTGTGGDAVGYAISGTALRLRLIPTDKAGRAKGRAYDDGLPRIVGMMILLDNATLEAGGYARGWTKPEQPTIERRAGIPVDGLEEAQRHAALVNAGIESPRQAIAELHPEWDTDEIEAELAAIQAGRATTTPGGLGSLIGA